MAHVASLSSLFMWPCVLYDVRPLATGGYILLSTIQGLLNMHKCVEPETNHHSPVSPLFWTFSTQGLRKLISLWHTLDFQHVLKCVPSGGNLA